MLIYKKAIKILESTELLLAQSSLSGNSTIDLLKKLFWLPFKILFHVGIKRKSYEILVFITLFMTCILLFFLANYLLPKLNITIWMIFIWGIPLFLFLFRIPSLILHNYISESNVIEMKKILVKYDVCSDNIDNVRKDIELLKNNYEVRIRPMKAVVLILWGGFVFFLAHLSDKVMSEKTYASVNSDIEFLSYFLLVIAFVFVMLDLYMLVHRVIFGLIELGLNEYNQQKSNVPNNSL